MKEPSVYIFDLYGTLLDIWTDEEDPVLWVKLAEYYAIYGADWQPEELKRRYHSLIRTEERRMTLATGYRWPEVELGEIFWTLFREAPGRHQSSNRISSRNSRTWSAGAAAFFRLVSRRRFGLYPHSLPVLRELRKRGARIYLLSNAQAVFTRSELEVTGLSTVFDRIVLSSDTGLRKPQPELLKALLREEKIAPEDAVLVGNDMDTDMKIAVACGVPGVLLNTDGASLWALERRAEKYGPGVTLLPSGDLEDLLRLIYGEGLPAPEPPAAPPVPEEEAPTAPEETPAPAEGVLTEEAPAEGETAPLPEADAPAEEGAAPAPPEEEGETPATPIEEAAAPAEASPEETIS